MDKRNRSNVLLVEILIAILFFMLSATVLVQVFAASRNLTVRAGIETQALSQAQSVADRLCAAEDPEAALEEMGFIQYQGQWSREDENYSLLVTCETEQTEAGELWQGQVRAFYDQVDLRQVRPVSQELFMLPCTRYREVRS